MSENTEDIHRVIKYSEQDEYEDSEWKIKRLRKICNFEYGDGLVEEERDGGRYPVYGSGGITGWHSDYYIKGPAIITGRKGTIGEVFFSTKNIYPIDTTYYISKGETEESLRWLYYLLSHIGLDRVEASTANPSLNRDDAGNLKAPIPPREEQERIASVLYSVDELLGGLRGKKDNLQETKQGLMQDLLTGNKQVTPEMNVREDVLTTDQPSERQDSGWKYTKLNSVLSELITGSRPKGGGVDDGFAVSIGGAEVGSNGFVDLSDCVYVPEEYYDNLGINVRKNDILLTKDGANTGENALVRRELENTTVNEHVFVLRGDDSINQVFLHYCLLFPKFDKDIQAVATGSAQKGITNNFPKFVEIPIPPLWEQERIASVLYTVDEMISTVEDKIECLEEVKQGLMQDLLTGNKRTPETLEILEEILDEIGMVAKEMENNYDMSNGKKKEIKSTLREIPEQKVKKKQEDLTGADELQDAVFEINVMKWLENNEISYEVDKKHKNGADTDIFVKENGVEFYLELKNFTEPYVWTDSKRQIDKNFDEDKVIPICIECYEEIPNMENITYYLGRKNNRLFDEAECAECGEKIDTGADVNNIDKNEISKKVKADEEEIYIVGINTPTNPPPQALMSDKSDGVVTFDEKGNPKDAAFSDISEQNEKKIKEILDTTK